MEVASLDTGFTQEKMCEFTRENCYLSTRATGRKFVLRNFSFCCITVYYFCVFAFENHNQDECTDLLQNIFVL